MAIIQCQDCRKEISDAAPACLHCGRPQLPSAANYTPNLPVDSLFRPLNTMLRVGILFLPILFAWLTLAKGRSFKAKVLSFVWLLLWLIVFFNVDNFLSGANEITRALLEPSPYQVSTRPDDYDDTPILEISSLDAEPEISSLGVEPEIPPLVVKPEIIKEQVLRTGISLLISDYEDNEVAADNKYKNRIVETTGTVKSINKTFNDKIYVKIGTDKEYEYSYLHAWFEDSNNQKISNLRKGQKITVTCRIKGLWVSNVTGEECAIK